MRLIQECLSKQEGQGMVEYGLIIALVVLVTFTSIELFGIEVEDLFKYIKSMTSEAL